MRRWIALLLAAAMCALCAPALADGVSGGSTRLRSLTHNCPNTGIMLPATFSPGQTTYLLTVASWVSRPTFTPVAEDPSATITVNGRAVRSGEASQVIPLTDEPQAVTVTVTNGSASTTYTVYLQRRPSERRTRVSAGYISNIYLKGTTWRIDADLVTLHYSDNSGNRSTFTNGSIDSYDFPVSPHCMFYYGTKENCFRAVNIQEFVSHYLLYGSSLYTIVYLEDEIVAVVPYGSDT